MEVEHCFALDSLDTFVTSNYGGTQTHPRMEWEFVVCPVAGKAYPGIYLGEDAQFFPSDAAVAAWQAQAEPGTAQIIYD